MDIDPSYVTDCRELVYSIVKITTLRRIWNMLELNENLHISEVNYVFEHYGYVKDVRVI
jgi:hypothetical protein